MMQKNKFSHKLNPFLFYAPGFQEYLHNNIPDICLKVIKKERIKTHKIIFLAILSNSGARPSEVSNYKVVSFDHEYITVELKVLKKKTKDVRRLIRIEFKKWNIPVKEFQFYEGKMADRSTYFRFLKQYFGFNARHFRQLWAIWIYHHEGGMVAKKFMEHENFETTRHYIKIDHVDNIDLIKRQRLGKEATF